MVQLVSAVLRVIFDTFRAPEKKTPNSGGFRAFESRAKRACRAANTCAHTQLTVSKDFLTTVAEPLATRCIYCAAATLFVATH
jgi:hypothetical protein